MGWAKLPILGLAGAVLGDLMTSALRFASERDLPSWEASHEVWCEEISPTPNVMAGPLLWSMVLILCHAHSAWVL